MPPRHLKQACLSNQKLCIHSNIVTDHDRGEGNMHMME